MRYVEFYDGGVVISPRRTLSHRDMVIISGGDFRQVISAGFLAARYSADEPWETYGKSTGLNIECNEKLVIPNQLFVGKVRSGILFASKEELLKGCTEIQLASWGFTAEGLWKDLAPVFSPLHSDFVLDVDQAMRD